MSEVYLRGTEVLGRLKSACAALGQKSAEALELVVSDIAATREWLSERQGFWLREKGIAEEHLAAAEANFAACEASGYWDDDGNYFEPDCNDEASEVTAAQTRLDECCRQLAKIEEWGLRCETAISSFSRAKGSFEVTVLQRLPSAEHYLDTKHEQYGAAIASSITAAAMVVGASIQGNNRENSSKNAASSGRSLTSGVADPTVKAGPLLMPNDSTGIGETTKASASTHDGSVDIDCKNPRSAATALVATKELFERAGIRQGHQVTVQNVQALRALLTQADFRSADSIVGKIANQSPYLNDAFLLSVVRDFSSMIPANVAERLPQFDLTVKDLGPNTFGKYDGHTIFLSSHLSESKARETIYHEMGHWFHNNGPEWYREAVRDHFRDRTAGEEIAKLDGYTSQGKADGWNDPYTGRIYEFERDDPQGVEIPSTHFQILAYSDEECAWELSLPECQETMEITLSGTTADGGVDGDNV